MAWGSVIADSTSSRSTSRINRSSTCCDLGSGPRTSMTTVWGGRWTGCTHDVTRLFAGPALRARRAFGVEAGWLHTDTTLFSVHGQYAAETADASVTDAPVAVKESSGDEAEDPAGDEESEPAVIEVTYGYSRDHR